MAANRYRIARVIGRGGAAEVLEAHASGERGFERRVAIKRLLPEFATDETLADAFLDEARIVSQLHHANVVSILDFGVMDGLPFMVLELVRGVDLGRLLEERGPLPPPLALHVAAEVANALDHAHAARGSDGQPLGIVHRDVTPRNILLSFDGDVKLGDFGIARAEQRLAKTKAGYAKGTLGFMAPEQALSTAVDGRADLFALGCVLHAMLTGASPLQEDEARQRFLRDQQLELDGSIPANVRELIRVATSYQAQARYASAGDMVEELGRALASVLEGHPRSMLKAFLRPLTPSEEPAPLDDLFDVELVLDKAVRRFESRAVAPPAGVEVGQTLGSYRLVAHIGRGGMADVYQARHAVLSREYAVKVMRNRAASETTLKRFEREARLLSELRHPNVVEVFDFGTTDTGLPYVVMELLDGPSLSQVILNEAPVPEADAIRILREMASALEHAHQAGVVHRDLKPGNVILAPEVKILDFGIARVVGSETRLTSGGLLGTPGYMAPEQMRDPRQAGPAADLFSLGAVAYRLMTGRPVFRGLDRTPPRPLSTKSGLGVLVMDLLSLDPNERPPSASAVIERLEDVHPTTLSERPTRVLEPPPKRSDTRSVLMGAVLVVAVGLLSFAYAVTRTEAPEELPTVIAPAPPPPVVRVVRAEAVERNVVPPPPDTSSSPPVESPPPVVETPAAVKTTRRSARPVVDVDALDASLREALERKGLRLREIRDGGRWRDARETPQRAAELHRALLAEIERTVVDRRLVQAKLGRLRQAIQKMPDERAAPLETRYLRLSARETRAQSEQELIAIAQEAERLIRSTR